MAPDMLLSRLCNQTELFSTLVLHHTPPIRNHPRYIPHPFHSPASSADLEIHYRRTTSLQDFVAAGGGGAATMAKPPAPNSPPVVELMSAPPSGRDAVRSNLISAGVPDSSNPFWQEEEEHSRSGISGNGGAAVGWGAFSGSPGPHGAGPTQANGSVLGVAQQQHADPYAAAEGAAQAGDSLGGGQRPGLITDQAGLQGLDGNRGPPSADPLTDPSPLPHGVVWGPLVFEARRFVELRKLSFLGALRAVAAFGLVGDLVVCVVMPCTAPWEE